MAENSILNVFRSILQDRYDVAFSLHGGDSAAFVEPIARHLLRRGLKVFFHRDGCEAEKSLGSNLKTRLPEIYSERARLVLVVASPNYSQEGLSRLEWDAIRQRKLREPESQFLILIADTPNPQELPEDFRSLAFLNPVKGASSPWPAPVVRVVLHRLGRWQATKAAFYHLLLAAAMATLLFHWSTRTYLSSLAQTLTCVAASAALLWLLAFRIVPRTAPAIVYAPQSIPARLFQQVYLNPVSERLLFAAVLAATLVAHVVLPSRESEMQEAMTAWLGDSQAARASALNFYQKRAPRNVAVRHWTAVLVDGQRYQPIERGMALDMISRLLAAEVKQQPVMEDIAGMIRDSAERYELGLTPDSWPAVLSGVVAAGVDLDHAVFARMHFAGKETSFARAQIKQADLSGTYWQGVNFDQADLRWSRFPLASFLGTQGTPTLSGAMLPEATLFGCNLEGVSFYGADLTGTRFLSCRLAGADFTNSYLTGVTFEDCDLRRAKFTSPDVRRKGRWGILAGVRFIRCQLAAIGLAGADLRGQTVSFYRAATVDPSNLSALTTVYTRDPEFPGIDRNRTASVPVTPAFFVNCTMSQEPGDEVPPCFGEASAAGLLMDRSTLSSLPQISQDQLRAGGFNPNNTPEPLSVTDDRSWDGLKRDVLDPLFQAAMKGG